MFRHISIVLLTLFLLSPALVLAKRGKDEKAAEEAAEKKDEGKLKSATFAGLKLRAIGPALTSGRIADVAVDPENKSTWYVAVASGGVWKTTNAGTTWKPIFDDEGSYSIGCVTVDPTNHNVVWVGTGENNSQRSVGYGDGVYKSRDGGKSWKKMGLEASEHVGMIRVDPRDGDTVYVAAQGPLWSAGGERGLYKTTDGGENWQLVLELEEHAEHTGASEVYLDPRDGDTVYAVTYQRRRRVWSLINGGPGSGVHKSTDGGATWRKLAGGFPSGDVGRIGLAVSPADPDVLYAVVEMSDGEKAGVYRSVDRGESWERRSGYVSGSPQYYQELIPDPKDVDAVYSNDTWLRRSEDGGKTFPQVPETSKHVDNHSIWIDPGDTRHVLAGCDGGLYETFDRGATWKYVANLPVTQFYKIGIDDAMPFYNVYGGTQDNFTLGGPSRTTSGHGITNEDWYITVGGDGFQTRVEPGNPDIVYSQSQYGNLSRVDLVSGEEVFIQPQPGPGEDSLRWNWDAPLVISPHSPTRLYFAANRLFRSDDRGSTWTAVSDDLTRQLDRDQLEMMGRLWSIDAVARHRSTSQYGNIVSLSESPLAEGLLYVGTDDGLVQVSEDGGGSWRKVETFPGIPELTYVHDLVASRHDEGTVYAAFNNHKSGDFKPYLLKSSDRGVTWTSISGDPAGSGLPERGSTYVVVEDPVVPELLFAGTELGVYFTLGTPPHSPQGDGDDSGVKWIELTGGMPTVAVRDLEIQEREGDLVVGSFGRGFFILDDYSPLRHVNAENLESEDAILFPAKDALSFNESYRLEIRGKSFQGDAFFTAPNPPAGAVFTYYLKEGLKSRREKRHEAEKEQVDNEEPIVRPPWEELRAEDREEKPTIALTVRDSEGHVIRRLTGPASAGIHRVSWDLRFPSPRPATLEPWSGNAFMEPPRGPRVVPDTYQVALSQRVDGEETSLGEPQSFQSVSLGQVTLPAADKAALLAFQRKAARLQRAALGAAAVASSTVDRIALIKKAVDETAYSPLDPPEGTVDAAPELGRRARELEARLWGIRDRLTGDRVKQRRNAPAPVSILERMGLASGGWSASSDATTTQQEAYDIAATELEALLAELRVLVEEDLAKLHDDLEAAGAPWTPGALPRWTRE